MEIQLDIDSLDAEQTHTDKIFVEHEEGRTLLVFRRGFLDVVISIGPNQLKYLIENMPPNCYLLDKCPGHLSQDSILDRCPVCSKNA